MSRLDNYHEFVELNRSQSHMDGKGHTLCPLVSLLGLALEIFETQMFVTVRNPIRQRYLISPVFTFIQMTIIRAVCCSYPQPLAYL